MTDSVAQTAGASTEQYLHCKIGSINVTVQSDDQKLLDDLRVLYHGYDRPSPVPEQAIRMVIRDTGRSRLRGRRYRIYGDGEEIGRERSRREVLPFVEWGINWRVIANHPEYLQVHAGTMAHLGRGFVFAAAPGSGKSTLAAGLLARGWTYLSDEFALIDRKTLRLHPFPKALCIKAGSFEVVRRLGLSFTGHRYYVKGFKGRVGYINPHVAEPYMAPDPTPIRYIVFPKYTGTDRPHLYPISRARALLDLAECTFNRNVLSDQLLSVLGDAVSQAQCFRLEAGAIEDTCDLIESSLCRAPEPAHNAGLLTSGTKCISPSRGAKPNVPPSRRNFLRGAVKLAYVTPAVLALNPQEALAAGSNHSCYPAGHVCPGQELCCDDMVCSGGVCTNEVCVESGGLCFADSDCCTNDCQLGACQ